MELSNKKPDWGKIMKRISLTSLALGIGLSSAVVMAQVSVPYTFVANQPARAAEVNDNFAALVAVVEALKAELADAKTDIAALQAELLNANAEITELQNSPVQGLADFVEVYPTSALVPIDTGSRGPLIRFTGANVQIVNDDPSNPINGLGNLIVGYDEDRITGDAFCSVGNYTDNITCTQNQGVFEVNQKSGSHNLVLGNNNAYTSWGGLVAGQNNVINGLYSSVTGGRNNTASGRYSSISGGYFNITTGVYSSISGGYSNTTKGDISSISGGSDNTAGGVRSSVLGGAGTTLVGTNAIYPQ